MREWIVTFFGAGKSPVAPGTAGSLATAGIILLLHHWIADVPSRSISRKIAGIILASAASVALGPWAIGHFGRKDPGPFVLDEVAGVCLTMLMSTPDAEQRRGTRVMGPLLTRLHITFRIFEPSAKPRPAGCSKSLPHAGWGILMDDLMAAVYANLLSQLVTRFLLG